MLNCTRSASETPLLLHKRSGSAGGWKGCISMQSDGVGTTKTEPTRCISKSWLDHPLFWRWLTVCIILLAGGVSGTTTSEVLISLLNALLIPIAIFTGAK